MRQATYALAAIFAAFEAIAIHSALDGNPSAGALLGLVFVGGAVFAMTRQVRSRDERSVLLSRLAIFASIVGIVCGVVLSGRIAEARGVDPASGPLVRTVLLLCFQLGWALTHWLSVEKKRGDQMRYVPAALGAVILVGGGMMTVGGSAEASVEADAGAVYKLFASSEDFAFARETERVGEESGSAFAHYHTGREPLVGLSFDTKEWFGRERISELVGIFEAGAESEGSHRIEARPGYVVASVELQADDHVNAIRVEFAPFDGEFLSPSDWYWSDWIGSHDPFAPTIRLDGGADLVVGVRGASGMVLNSLSLLTASPDN